MEKMKPTTEKLFQLFVSAQPSIHKFWGHQEAEAEALHLASLVINLLENQLAAETVLGLIWALEHPVHLSECVLVPPSLDRLTWMMAESRGMNLHALVCKLWRWPDMTPGQKLHSDIARCIHSQPHSYLVCINPQHYQQSRKVTLPLDSETLLVSNPWLKDAMMANLQIPPAMEPSLANALVPLPMQNYWEAGCQPQGNMMMTVTAGPGSQPEPHYAWMSPPTELPTAKTRPIKRAAKRKQIDCEKSANTEMPYVLSPDVASNSDLPKQDVEMMDTHTSTYQTITPETNEEWVPCYESISPSPPLEGTYVSESHKRPRIESNSYGNDDVIAFPSKRKRDASNSDYTPVAKMRWSLKCDKSVNRDEDAMTASAIANCEK